MKKKMTSAEPAIPTEISIREIRGQRVLLDSDLASIYGVPTFRFNEAIKRNRQRFPTDFMFQLTPEEFEAVNSSQFAMSSKKHRGASYLPYAFTEHGALQAANILKSERAVAMSVFVIRAFIQMREQLAANATIENHLAAMDRKLLEHDEALSIIWRQLKPLLAPPPEPPKPRIGFKP